MIDFIKKLCVCLIAISLLITMTIVTSNIKNSIDDNNVYDSHNVHWYFKYHQQVTE